MVSGNVSSGAPPSILERSERLAHALDIFDGKMKLLMDDQLVMQYSFPGATIQRVQKRLRAGEGIGSVVLAEGKQISPLLEESRTLKRLHATLLDEKKKEVLFSLSKEGKQKGAEEIVARSHELAASDHFKGSLFADGAIEIEELKALKEEFLHSLSLLRNLEHSNKRIEQFARIVTLLLNGGELEGQTYKGLKRDEQFTNALKADAHYRNFEVALRRQSSLLKTSAAIRDLVILLQGDVKGEDMWIKTDSLKEFLKEKAILIRKLHNEFGNDALAKEIEEASKKMGEREVDWLRFFKGQLERIAGMMKQNIHDYFGASEACFAALSHLMNERIRGIDSQIAKKGEDAYGLLLSEEINITPEKFLAALEEAAKKRLTRAREGILVQCEEVLSRHAETIKKLSMALEHSAQIRQDADRDIKSLLEAEEGIGSLIPSLSTLEPKNMIALQKKMASSTVFAQRLGGAWEKNKSIDREIEAIIGRDDALRALEIDLLKTMRKLSSIIIFSQEEYTALVGTWYKVGAEKPNQERTFARAA